MFEEGRSPELLKKFYYLQVLTRRRHGVPPPPVAWFGALLSLLAEKAIIRLVSSDGRPVAACMILFDKNSAVYKYGGSDPRYNSLRGTTLLYWRTIQDARLRRAKTLDLGRSDVENRGLIRFKSEWGTTDLPLTYWHSPANPEALQSARYKAVGGRVLARLPGPVLAFLARALYRYAG